MWSGLRKIEGESRFPAGMTNKTWGQTSAEIQFDVGRGPGGDSAAEEVLTRGFPLMEPMVEERPRVVGQPEVEGCGSAAGAIC